MTTQTAAPFPTPPWPLPTIGRGTEAVSPSSLPTGETARLIAPARFDDVVASSHRRLVRLAYVLCGNTAQAEDAVADAYARVWPRWRAGKVDDLDAYLRRAVVNGVRNRHRHRLVRRRHEERRMADTVQQPFEEAVADHDLVWDALQALPVAQQQVVVLRYLEDLSEAETARALDVPVGTVKSRLARALSTMATRLDGTPR
ncbi:MAG: sigma-70 family RNA polymerase sigma factor [Acidimicrobiales bacterium]